MKIISEGNDSSRKFAIMLTRALGVAGFLFGVVNGFAQAPPPGKYALPAPLDSWSFTDTNYWTSDSGYPPVSFTNITSMLFGDGTSLVINTNVPAWLQYNTSEGGTNEISIASGSVTFWYAPNWSSTNDLGGGLGPQEYGRLIEIGGYTPDSSFGLWSIYVDPAGANLYFSSQTNDDSGNIYTIAAPIDFTTNYWHFIALTYSPTNVSLYLDGQQLTNDPGGLNIWPGPVALSNGMFFGSDSNGIYQAEGNLDDVKTYDVVMDSNTVHRAFSQSELNYFLNPWNWQYMAAISSAPSNPSTNAVTPDVITGAGYLQWVTNATTCVYGSDAYHVWITNVTASAAGGGNVNVTFTIEGGQDGYYYDVFATGALQGALTNDVWFWMGQGQHCNTYTIPNISSTDAFLILGTPLDSDGDGLTDAYELLVSHTDPHNPYSNLDGILDGWDVLLGLNPQTSNLTTASERSNYGYTTADWLNGVSGVKSGTINLDNEGNVLSVSQ
jgi:hypothetical protein